MTSKPAAQSRRKIQSQICAGRMARIANAGRFHQSGTQTAAGKAPANPACSRYTPLHRELAGCRLVYLVEDDALIVLVLSVGKREDNVAYLAAAKRIK